MAQIVAGIYELQEKIGAGGGGVVYLGRHLRLNKKVVLKADKRTLNTSQDNLRREVDLLKDLSQTYIPQVYDFVQQDGVVYTVMDYIEGESLDKILARGELPGQPQVIQWACQLLEALIYLHCRPPHGILHGDIKPANIMVRPGGDICLIDFNIALALGEDGAVKVGFSRGYASPEHYGAEYGPADKAVTAGTISEWKERKKQKGKKTKKSAREFEKNVYMAVSETTEVDMDETKTDEEITETDGIIRSDEENLIDIEKEHGGTWSGFSRSQGTTGSATEGRRAIRLDVRSDIYSLGATLYHLLSGRKPDQDAKKVKPLTTDTCSFAVSAIIQKAMAPDPADRFQSAEEMLDAIRALHKKDPRVISHRRHILVSASILTVMFLAGSGSAFIGLRQMEQVQAAHALAEYSANSLAEGNKEEAVKQALQAIPQGNSIFEGKVTAQAQKALTDALGVYDLKDGFKTAGTLELPGAPFDLTLSPEGSRLAVVYAFETAVYDLETGERLTALPLKKSALSDCFFVDESRIVYAGDKGVTAFDLESGQVLWQGEEATFLAVSADGSRVAAVDRDADHAVIYRTSDGSVVAECSFGERHLSAAANDIFADPQDNLLKLNRDGSLLAVSFSDGGFWIFNVEDPEGDLIIFEESSYSHFEGGFYGKYLAFMARGAGKKLFGMVDSEACTYLGDFESQEEIHLQADERGIFLSEGNILVSLQPQEEQGNLTLEETELAYTGSENITAFSIGENYCLTVDQNNGLSFFDSGANLSSTENYGVSNDFTALGGEFAILGNRNEPILHCLKLEAHEEAFFLKYDARYEHEEARVSPDGEYVMLFSYQGFCIYDKEGSLLTEVELPDSEKIYDQQYRKDGEPRLEVIWYDGTVRLYSAADGLLISESVGEPPSKDLYEEFITEDYRIASSLHEAPKVFDRTTGDYLASLEEESFLTYVTQTGDYLITEYISSDGERYGLLLNSDFETLAVLPHLCDVNGETLVFDYESGNLRVSPLYSLQELVDLGKSYL